MSNEEYKKIGLYIQVQQITYPVKAIIFTNLNNTYKSITAANGYELKSYGRDHDILKKGQYA